MPWESKAPASYSWPPPSSQLLGRKPANHRFELLQAEAFGLRQRLEDPHGTDDAHAAKDEEDAARVPAHKEELRLLRLRTAAQGLLGATRTASHRRTRRAR